MNLGFNPIDFTVLLIDGREPKPKSDIGSKNKYAYIS
jgi:hypothetical protein